MRRLFYLYKMWWLGLVHRLRHDLARELTFGIASCVLIATFFYVFNDFLNVQVAGLSATMHRRFAQCTSLLLLLLTAATAASWLRRERQAATGVRQMARQLGESQSTLTAWSWLYALTLIGLSHGGCWWVVQRWLTEVPPLVIVAVEALLLVLTITVLRLPAATEPKLLQDPPLEQRQSLGWTLYQWRFKQLVWRNHASQLCLLLGMAFVLVVAVAALRGLPLFVAAVSALAGAYLATSALCFQLADDLASSWTERGAGVTHEQFIRCYSWLGATLACFYAVGAGVAFVGGSLAHPPSGSSPLGPALQIAAVALVPGLIAPMLSLQIDGRRSGTNLLLLLIATLFIGTAVFAHWLGLLLIPILGSFALKSQAGRFYRA